MVRRGDDSPLAAPPGEAVPPLSISLPSQAASHLFPQRRSIVSMALTSALSAPLPILRNPQDRACRSRRHRILSIHPANWRPPRDNVGRPQYPVDPRRHPCQRRPDRKRPCNANRPPGNGLRYPSSRMTAYPPSRLRPGSSRHQGPYIHMHSPAHPVLYPGKNPDSRSVHRHRCHRLRLRSRRFRAHSSQGQTGTHRCSRDSNLRPGRYRSQDHLRGSDPGPKRTRWPPRCLHMHLQKSNMVPSVRGNGTTARRPAGRDAQPGTHLRMAPRMARALRRAGRDHGVRRWSGSA